MIINGGREQERLSHNAFVTPRATVRANTAAPNENYASSANGFLKLMA